jgi:hypothetical protein
MRAADSVILFVVFFFRVLSPNFGQRRSNLRFCVVPNYKHRPYFASHSPMPQLKVKSAIAKRSPFALITKPVIGKF